jgi:hypothetical protein
MMQPAVKTHITPAAVAIALRSAWMKLFGQTPSDGTVALLMAQSALETGRWKSCWNYNLGNIKGGGKWSGDTCQFRLNEVIGGKVVWFDPPHPQTTMRAYPDLTAAASDYLWLLARRFQRAWPHVLRPDAVAFSQALKAQNYYTAPEPPYTRAVVSLFREYLGLVTTLGNALPVAVATEPHPDHEELRDSIAPPGGVYDEEAGECRPDTEPAPPMETTDDH